MADADNYPIVIRRADNGYVVEATTLGLRRAGPNLQMLEEEIRIAVKDILAVCDRHGAHIEAISEGQAGRPRGEPYRRTITQAMIVVLVLVVISMPLIWGLQKLTNLTTTLSSRLNAEQIASSVVSGISRTADTLETTTPERRDQLARDVGRIARALEPYAVQLRPLWLSSGPASGKPLPADGRQ